MRFSDLEKGDLFIFPAELDSRNDGTMTYRKTGTCEYTDESGIAHFTSNLRIIFIGKGK